MNLKLWVGNKFNYIHFIKSPFCSVVKKYDEGQDSTLSKGKKRKLDESVTERESTKKRKVNESGNGYVSLWLCNNIHFGIFVMCDSLLINVSMVLIPIGREKSWYF